MNTTTPYVRPEESIPPEVFKALTTINTTIIRIETYRCELFDLMDELDYMVEDFKVVDEEFTSVLSYL